MAIVVLSPDATRQAVELPIPIRRRVMKIVKRLEEWPEVSGAKPLRGKLAGRYRIRTGDYRVQFRVESESVIIEHVGHRDGFYGD